MVADVRLYPITGNAANVSRFVVIFAVGGSVAWTRAIAAFTLWSVWTISTCQEKNKSISAVPRLVIDHTRSRPWTLLTASSIGRVTMTSIWSIGATPLSTPTTMRGKLVSGKTAMGIVSDRYAPTATIVRITKMMGLACSDVQWGASASTAGGGTVESSLIFSRTSPSRPASHRLRPASRRASQSLLSFHPEDRRRPPSPPDRRVLLRSKFAPYRAREYQSLLSFRALLNRFPRQSPMCHRGSQARLLRLVQPAHSA